MRSALLVAATLVVLLPHTSFANSELLLLTAGNIDGDAVQKAFPDLADRSDANLNFEEKSMYEPEIQTAIWPFKKKDDGESSKMKPKSSRKAFLLSFLFPGLGEFYMGSKTGLLFAGIEAFSWWIYLSKTNEGKDIEKDFRRYADTHWHYTETTGSQGQALDHNYWKWIQKRFQEVGKPDDIDPADYNLINSQLEAAVQNSNSSIYGHSVHSLPSTKSQQYYEMIGKYPQFVYGWEDITDTEANPTIKFDDGSINFTVPINQIKSAMRSNYEDLRDDSNKKLKAGQRGIHYMLINRVLSGIHAARLAYHHNKKLDSELSKIDIYFTEKYIIDNRVPMLMISKKF